MYLRIEGYPPVEFLTKHNLPEEALFFQPPSVKRLRAWLTVDKDGVRGYSLSFDAAAFFGSEHAETLS